MRGRALGRGRLLRREGRAGQVAYLGDWVGPDGKRHRKLLSGDKRTAERMLADVIRKRDLELSGLLPEHVEDVRLGDLAARYLSSLDIRTSSSHARVTRRDLNRILRGLEARTLQDLRPTSVHAYLKARAATGAANRTVNLDLIALKAMLSWAVSNGLILGNPLAGVKRLPEGPAYQRHRRRALDEAEITALICAACEDDSRLARRKAASESIRSGTKSKAWSGRRRSVRIPQAALWLALLETGARWGELVQTAWGDLNERERTLTFRASTTKSRKERIVPVRQALIRALHGLRVLHHHVYGRLPSAPDPIFLSPAGKPWTHSTQNALRDFNRLLSLAGIPKRDARGCVVDIHCLRHTFASRLARAGVGLVHAQKLLGHSDPKLTSAIYTHLSADELRNAIEGLPKTGDGELLGSKSAVAHQPIVQHDEGGRAHPLKRTDVGSGGPRRTRTCDQAIMSRLL